MQTCDFCSNPSVEQCERCSAHCCDYHKQFHYVRCDPPKPAVEPTQ